MDAAIPVLAPTKLEATLGPNLYFLCVQQSGAAPFVKIMQSFILM